MRLSMFDRAGILQSHYHDLSSKSFDALRIIIGLMFCDEDGIGYDPSIFKGPDCDSALRVTIAGVEYRLLEKLFQSRYSSLEG